MSQSATRTGYSVDEVGALERRVEELEAAVVFLARERLGARGARVNLLLQLLAKYGFPLRESPPSGRRLGAAPLGAEVRTSSKTTRR